MLASPGSPFDSDQYLFEIKWDGIRALAFFGKGLARLQGRKLTDSSDRYPEICRLKALPGRHWTGDRGPRREGGISAGLFEQTGGPRPRGETRAPVSISRSPLSQRRSFSPAVEARLELLHAPPIVESAYDVAGQGVVRRARSGSRGSREETDSHTPGVSGTGSSWKCGGEVDGSVGHPRARGQTDRRWSWPPRGT
jgi:hypothetical protein